MESDTLLLCPYFRIVGFQKRPNNYARGSKEKELCPYVGMFWHKKT